jgi:dTDP-4-amino-4,6-dideoxygalactose transaminase
VIPLVDLKAQYRSIKQEIDAAIQSVLDNAQFVLGREVAAFEEEFAAYTGAKYCIAVNSGTSALHLALLAAGIGPGDEVITVPFSFVATVAAVEYTGATPVLVDVEPRYFCMDVSQIERAITPRTKAILPVHLFGQAADLDGIMEVARRHNLTVIEDACQSHGAEYRGRSVGGIGEMGCFSFYPGKNLGAYGEGGAVVTNNAEHARKIRLLRNWGEEKRYHHVVKAFNYRMEGMQGAILRVKLRHLPAWVEARRAHAASYGRLLAGCGLTLPEEMPGTRHSFSVYAVRTRQRDQLVKALDAAEIGWAIYYPIPIHLLEAYANLGYRRGDFPVSEELSGEELSLPVYPEMTEEQIETVGQALACAGLQPCRARAGLKSRAG